MMSVDQLRTPTADQAEIDRLSAAVLRMPAEDAAAVVDATRLQRFAMRVEDWVLRSEGKTEARGEGSPHGEGNG